MYDALVYLFEHFQSLGHLPSRHYISEKLNEAGFDYEEITTVLKCFDDIFNENNQYTKLEINHFNEKMRVFSPHEIQAIPQEIRGFLHYLYKEKAIDYSEIELIIHAIMQIDSEELDLESVKIITLIIAWANQSEIPVFVGDDLLSALYNQKLIH